MSSYWKSNNKKRCDICECWIADNKASIDFHEKGKKHQEKKQKKISAITKKSKIQNEFNQKADYFLRKMEKEATKKYREDLKGQGYNDEQIIKMTASSSTKNETQKPKSKPTSNSHRSDPKTVTKPSQITVETAPIFTPTPTTGHPYGKWQTVSEIPKQKTFNQVTLKPAAPKEEKIEFAEKRIINVDSSSGPTAFKKRKTDSNSKSRSIRKRNTD